MTRAEEQDRSGHSLAFTDQIKRWAPAAIVFFGSFLPTTVATEQSFVQRHLGIAAIPEVVQMAVVAVLSVVTVRMVPHRKWPLFAVAFAAEVLRSTWPPLSVASYLAATTLTRSVHLVAYTAGAVVLLVLPPLAGTSAGLPGREWADLFGALGSTALFVGLPVMIGLWVNARRQVLAGLRSRAEQLEREQTARAEQARAQERARIAHDMHDIVAHRVSLMVLHAVALEVNAEDGRTAEQAELIRATGQQAMAQLRDVLGVLHSTEPGGSGSPQPQPQPQPTLAELDRLLDQSRSAGVPITRRDHGVARPLPTMVENTVFHVVREALTNLHKHAGKAAAEIVLRYLPQEFQVTVRNDAPEERPEPFPSSGLGLVGLRERVELLGGELSAHPSPGGGFTVSARLPLPAD